MTASQRLFIVCLVFRTSLDGPATTQAAESLRPALRRPVAVALAKDESFLVAANRDAGTLSLVGLSHNYAVTEVAIEGQPTDLTLFDRDQRLAVVDRRNSQLVFLQRQDQQWQIEHRQPLPHDPICMAWHPESSRLFVTSLWSRTVSGLHVAVDNPTLAVRHHTSLRLPFEPRELAVTPAGERLIVTDAFGGNLAIIDVATWQLVGVHQPPGHNIRGLAFTDNGQTLMVAQQILNPYAQSIFTDVHWGNMINNVLVRYPVDKICDVTSTLVDHRHVLQLGEASDAAGDPGPVVCGTDGELAVLYSGVHAVGVGRQDDLSTIYRVAVGRRPTAAVLGQTARLFVANMYDDSISIVDVNTAELLQTISLGPQRDRTSVEQGEELFYDSRLAHAGWMSCHSCHSEGFTNGLRNDNRSDLSFGAPKRVPSLLGVGSTAPYAWNGQTESLPHQVHASITATMQGDEPRDEQVDAIAAYLESLPPPPVLPTETRSIESIEAGRKLFHDLNCATCHQPPSYTSADTYDVGLQDEVGNDHFNPPSLRGVGRRRTFFHDGRVTKLADVFIVHQHQLPRELSASEVATLESFLESL
ncbi:MAG: c-type cytochrome [Planctomycetales bacterium]|nr:c-type cytochrome [Planctomycetales bacterium]